MPRRWRPAVVERAAAWRNGACLADRRVCSGRVVACGDRLRCRACGSPGLWRRGRRGTGRGSSGCSEATAAGAAARCPCWRWCRWRGRPPPRGVPGTVAARPPGRFGGLRAAVARGQVVAAFVCLSRARLRRAGVLLLSGGRRWGGARTCGLVGSVDAMCCLPSSFRFPSVRLPLRHSSMRILRGFTQGMGFSGRLTTQARAMLRILVCKVWQARDSHGEATRLEIPAKYAAAWTWTTSLRRRRSRAPPA